MKYFKNENNQFISTESTDERYLAFLKNGGYIEISESEYQKLTEPPAPTQEQILENLKREFTARIDAILNETAQSKGYDNINTAVSYAGYTNSFKAEGVAFGKWRSAVWEWGYSLLAQQEKMGEDFDYTSVNLDEILATMPKFEDFNK